MPPCLMFAKEPCGKDWTLEQEGGSVNWMYLQHSHSRFGCVPTSHGSYRRNVSSTFANGTASAFAIMDRNVYSVGSLGETSSSSLVFRRIGDGIFFCTNSLTFLYIFNLLPNSYRTGVPPLARPSPRTRPSSASLSVISSMRPPFVISRTPRLTRSTSSPSSTSRCTTALRPLSISVLSVAVPKLTAGSVLLLRGSSSAGAKKNPGTIKKTGGNHVRHSPFCWRWC